MPSIFNQLRLRQLGWAVTLSGVFLVVYSFTNLLASHRTTVPSVYFSWEKYTPFVPAMIVPYMSIDLFFFFAPFLCADRKQLRAHAMRILFAIAVAGSIFVVAPLKYGFDRPVVDSVFAPIFTLLWSADLPFNLAPSLHLALRTILWPVYVRRTQGILRVAVKTWFIAIGVSTLLVHQHHVIDVASGVALGMLALYVFDERIAQQRTGRVFIRTAARYFLGAAALILAAMSLAPWGGLLLWPALSLTLVGCAYAGVGPRVFRKLHNGHMMTAAKWVLEPYLLGQKFFAWVHNGSVAPFVHVTHHLLIGRRFSVGEATAFTREHQPVCVVDLAAEFQERPALRGTPHYVNVPMLDLVPPTPEQLDAAVSAIWRHESMGIVYVHCSMGLYRSILVAGAYLIFAGIARDGEDAVLRMRRIRPDAICNDQMKRLLDEFTTRLGDKQQTRSNELPDCIVSAEA